ncbi:MAG TPA: hypothetical protein VJX72_08070 [Candidatus Acidoferrum sp.]|nr:hypothetical protein [Candidatus Acidoferrum sp.]
MRHKRVFAGMGVFLGGLLLFSPGSVRAQTKPAASGTVTFTVTAVGKKESAPPIGKDDVQLFQGKERKQIGDWKKEDQLYLAILIDSSIDTGAGGQWDYLKEFIMAQPASTSIAVGYLQNNTTQVAQDFTPDKAAAVKALRLPLGIGALGASPYLGTLDMLKRWPNTGPRRSILLITSGIDYFRGGGFGAFYPDLDNVIQRAERQNTNIWSIYYPSSGHRGHSFYLVNYAQNNIDKMSEDTGAESFFLGMGQPVSIKPYLDEITTHLNNQYLLTFAGSGGSKGKFQNVKVKTELPDVEFFAPAAVFLPPGS